jgi:hypothetical protein
LPIPTTLSLYLEKRLRHAVSFFSLLFLAIFPVVLHSQDFSYMRYEMKDGLPSSTIYDVTQDKNGFIWLATENGLCRFDGKQFKTYSTKNGLPDNAVLIVEADTTGRVYFAPFTHVPYVIYHDSIYKIRVAEKHARDLSDLSNIARYGDLIIAETKTSYLINQKDSIIPYSDVVPGFLPEFRLLLHGDRFYDIGTRNDSMFLVKNGKIVRIDTFDKKTSNAPYYLSTGERIPLRGFTPRGGQLINSRYFYYIERDKITMKDMSDGTILWEVEVPKATRVFIDNEKNTWVSTLGNGLYRFPSTEFRHITLEKATQINSLEKKGETLLVGGEQSTIIHLSVNQKKQEISSADYSGFLAQSLNPIAQSTKFNRVMKMLKKSDTLYIGADGFLLRKTPADTRFCRIFPVKDIDTCDRQLLVCTGTGVMLVNASTLSIDDTLLTGRTTCGVVFNGGYYIGSLGGFIRIDRKTRVITSLVDLHPSLKSRITALRKGNDNDLWIATSGGGLLQYKNGKIVNTFNESSGLNSDICSGLFIDGPNIWVGTNKGLNKIDLSHSSPKIISFTTANGLVSDFISTIFVDSTNVYAGSVSGLTYFNKEIESTPSVCLLHIMQVSQGNQVLRLDASYVFPHSALNIKIDFTAISFKSAGDNIYYYKLDGLDTGWLNTTNTFVNYATLPPGDYTFTIRAVNKFGVESETKTIRIVITPPWWQTWWFITLAGIGFATAVFFIYRRNINAIKKREKTRRINEAKLAALEQQALQAQMNPHFIFNCLNSIQSFILDFDAEGANEYLSAFASMIRQTLDNSSHPLISIADETRYLDTYLQLEKLRFREKFNYRIQVAEEIDTFGTWIPGMLLQPYVENSLRHGIQHRSDNNGVISIEINTYEQGGLICLISDNGVGRKRAEEIKSKRHIEYQSKGTSISSKRVNAINNQFHTNIHISTSDIHDSNGEVAGTLVSIIIPELRKP